MTNAPLSRVAHPYVSGETRRFKAEPTKLGPLAARIMSASGAFSTKRTAAPRRHGAPVLWAALFFVAAGTFAVARDHAPMSEATRLQAILVEGGERVLALGMEEYAPPQDIAEAPATHDSQDQMEIARFLRYAAPAAGPATPAPARPGTPRLAAR